MDNFLMVIYIIGKSFAENLFFISKIFKLKKKINLFFFLFLIF
jgi:hypothetical protein